MQGSVPLQLEEVTGNVQAASDSEKTGALQPPEITLNTQLAFDSINGMFRGPLREEFDWQGYEPTATVRLSEPTVTMSTKAALDVVSGMFRSRLPHEKGTRKEPSEHGRVKERCSSARSRDSLCKGLSLPSAQYQTVYTFSLPSPEDTQLYI